jgi:hypothetical protein
MAKRESNEFVKLSKKIYDENKANGMSYTQAIKEASAIWKTMDKSPTKPKPVNSKEKTARATLIKEFKDLKKEFEATASAVYYDVPTWKRLQALIEVLKKTDKDMYSKTLKKFQKIVDKVDKAVGTNQPIKTTTTSDTKLAGDKKKMPLTKTEEDLVVKAYKDTLKNMTPEQKDAELSKDVTVREDGKIFNITRRQALIRSATKANQLKKNKMAEKLTAENTEAKEKYLRKLDAEMAAEIKAIQNKRLGNQIKKQLIDDVINKYKLKAETPPTIKESDILKAESLLPANQTNTNDTAKYIINLKKQMQDRIDALQKDMTLFAKSTQSKSDAKLQAAKAATRQELEYLHHIISTLSESNVPKDRKMSLLSQVGKFFTPIRIAPFDGTSSSSSDRSSRLSDVADMYQNEEAGPSKAGPSRPRGTRALETVPGFLMHGAPANPDGRRGGKARSADGLLRDSDGVVVRPGRNGNGNGNPKTPLPSIQQGKEFDPEDPDGYGNFLDHASQILSGNSGYGSGQEWISTPDRQLGSGLVNWFGSQGKTKQSKINKEDNIYALAAKDVYNKNRQSLEGYKYDASLSNKEMAVYKSNNEIIISFRGSQTLGDWAFTDTMLARGVLIYTPRFRRNLSVVKKIITENPGDAFVFVGHSLGGSIAIEMTKYFKDTGQNIRAVTFNAGTTIGTSKNKELDITHYHTKGDVVSALGVNKFKNDIVIDNPENPTKNVVDAHNMDRLVLESDSKEDEPEEEGSGFSPGLMDNIMTDYDFDDDALSGGGLGPSKPIPSAYQSIEDLIRAEQPAQTKKEKRAEQRAEQAEKKAEQAEKRAEQRAEQAEKKAEQAVKIALAALQRRQGVGRGGTAGIDVEALEKQVFDDDSDDSDDGEPVESLQQERERNLAIRARKRYEKEGGGLGPSKPIPSAYESMEDLMADLMPAAPREQTKAEKAEKKAEKAERRAKIALAELQRRQGVGRGGTAGIDMEALEKQVAEEMKAKKDAELEAKLRSMFGDDSDDSDDSDDGEPVESLQQERERNLAIRARKRYEKEGGGLGPSKPIPSAYESMEDLMPAAQTKKEKRAEQRAEQAEKKAEQAERVAKIALTELQKERQGRGRGGTAGIDVEALEKQVAEEMKAKKDAELEAKLRSMLDDDSDDSDTGEPVESLQEERERNLAIRARKPYVKEGGGLGGMRDSHGCIPSAGYSWDGSKCVRPWEFPSLV